MAHSNAVLVVIGPLTGYTLSVSSDSKGVYQMGARKTNVKDLEHTIYGKNVVEWALGDREPLKPAADNNKFRQTTITRRDFAGASMYSLTLEERHTCSATCGQLKTCYGNNMPFAKRYVFTAELADAIDQQLERLTRKRRIVVRLHVLGDFFSVEYVMFWHRMLIKYPNLAVFGYTHWPHITEQGRAVLFLNQQFPGRCVIKRSLDLLAQIGVAEQNKGYTIVVKSWDDTPKGWIRCPAQLDHERNGDDATVGCANCAICIDTDRNVVFKEH